MISGGCYCQEIRYESTKDPFHSGMCHCRMCQRWTGGPAAMGLFFERDHFKFTQGTPQTFMTSSILERQFCAKCGTPIGHRYVHGESTNVQIAFIGTLDEPSRFDGPRHHFGIESHLPKWVILEDGVQQIRADTFPGIARAFEEAERDEKDG